MSVGRSVCLEIETLDSSLSLEILFGEGLLTSYLLVGTGAVLETLTVMEDNAWLSPGITLTGMRMFECEDKTPEECTWYQQRWHFW